MHQSLRNDIVITLLSEWRAVINFNKIGLLPICACEPSFVILCHPPHTSCPSLAAFNIWMIEDPCFQLRYKFMYVSLSFTGEHTGTQEVAIAPDELVSCQVCFSSVVVVFMTLNNVGADKLRKKLRLNTTIDPAYDPAGSGERNWVCVDVCVNVHKFTTFAALVDDDVCVQSSAAFIHWPR